MKRLQRVRVHLGTAILAALLTSGPLVAGTNRLILDPPEKVVTPVGAKFSMLLALDSGVRNARFYNVHVAYDTSVIKIDSIVASDEWNATGPNFFFWKDTVTIDSVTGQPNFYIDLGAAFYGAVYHIDGFAPLARLWYTAKKPGATFSHFQSAVVLDANSTPVLSETRDAVVFVCPYSFAFFGDFDHTGNLDIADLSFLIAYLYLSGPSPEPVVLLGDVNCDQNVDIADVTALIDFLYISFTPLCSLCP